MHTLRIGTRASPLALWQARYVGARLRRRGIAVAFHEIITRGDRILDRPLAAIGGKGLFLKEIEQALLQGEVDVAVHSMKDMTATIDHNLTIAAICRREDPRDALVAERITAPQQLPAAALLGTCSVRRRCQLSAHFPRWRMVDLRGNLNTRLAKLARGDFDGIVLAAAGLRRLRMAHRIAAVLPPELCLPAVGQGAIAVQCRTADTATRTLIAPLNHAASALCITAERAVNERLGGGCHVPLAAYAELRRGRLRIRALVGSEDGRTVLRAERSGAMGAALDLGHNVAEELLAQGADALLANLHPPSQDTGTPP